MWVLPKVLCCGAQSPQPWGNTVGWRDSASQWRSITLSGATLKFYLHTPFLFSYGTVFLLIKQQDSILTWEALRWKTALCTWRNTPTWWGLIGNLWAFNPQFGLLISYTVDLRIGWPKMVLWWQTTELPAPFTRSSGGLWRQAPLVFGKHSLFFYGNPLFLAFFSQMSHLYSSTFSLAFYYFKKYCFAYVKTKDKYLCLVNLLFIYFLQEVKYQITLKRDFQACAEKVFEYYRIVHLWIFVQRFKKCAVWDWFFLDCAELAEKEGVGVVLTSGILKTRGYDDFVIDSNVHHDIKLFFKEVYLVI